MSVKNYFNSIALNNEGCEYLECGELLSARNCFRDALQFMTSAIVEAQKETMDQPQPLDTGERYSEYQWSVMPRVPLHFSSEAFFFQRGILIHRDDDDDDPEAGPSAFELSEESSMIVFNLGLAFHLLAISMNKAALLNEAMSFYQIAEAIRARRPLSRLPELIDLAIYNNMGHIEYELVNYERARAYFQMLKTALIIFSQNGLVDYISDQDSQGLVLNASMQEVTLAAAA
jgi:tetratricopeptide (TPR) repeat protein